MAGAALPLLVHSPKPFVTDVSATRNRQIPTAPRVDGNGACLTRRGTRFSRPSCVLAVGGCTAASSRSSRRCLLAVVCLVQTILRRTLFVVVWVVLGAMAVHAGTTTVESCTNGIKDPHETGVDCGGFSGGKACPPCANGIGCLVNTDCVSTYCSSGKCAPKPASSCVDGIKNGAETAIDCGGGTCAGCVAGKACVLPRDCKSGVCTKSVCIASSIASTSTRTASKAPSPSPAATSPAPVASASPSPAGNGNSGNDDPAPASGSPTPSPGAAAGGTSTATALPSPTRTPSSLAALDTSSATPASGLSTGAVIGIAIAMIVVGIVAVVLLVVFRRRQEPDSEDGGDTRSEVQSGVTLTGDGVAAKPLLLSRATVYDGTVATGVHNTVVSTSPGKASATMAATATAAAASAGKGGASTAVRPHPRSIDADPESAPVVDRQRPHGKRSHSRSGRRSASKDRSGRSASKSSKRGGSKHRRDKHHRHSRPRSSDDRALRHLGAGAETIVEVKQELEERDLRKERVRERGLPWWCWCCDRVLRGCGN